MAGELFATNTRSDAPPVSGGGKLTLFLLALVIVVIAEAIGNVSIPVQISLSRSKAGAGSLGALTNHPAWWPIRITQRYARVNEIQRLLTTRRLYRHEM